MMGSNEMDSKVSSMNARSNPSEPVTLAEGIDELRRSLGNLLSQISSPSTFTYRQSDSIDINRSQIEARIDEFLTTLRHTDTALVNEETWLNSNVPDVVLENEIQSLETEKAALTAQLLRTNDKLTSLAKQQPKRDSIQPQPGPSMTGTGFVPMQAHGGTTVQLQGHAHGPTSHS